MFTLYVVVALLLLAGLLGLDGHDGGQPRQVAAADPLLRLSAPSLTIEEICDSLDEGASTLAAGVRQPGQSDALRIDARTSLAASLQPGGTTSLTFPGATITAAGSTDRLIIANLALSGDRQVDVDLQRFTVFNAHTKFVAKSRNGDRVLSLPQVTFFRGHIIGDPASIVVISLSPRAVNGFISTTGATYALSSGRTDSWRAGADIPCALTDLDAIHFAPFSCGSETFDPRTVETNLAASVSAEPHIGLRVCEMAVVGDYEFYQETGPDAEASALYVAQLFAAISSIYERDLGVALVLRYVEVWTDQDDPFSICGSNGLEEFQQYGEAHLRDRSWNLAFKLSGCGGGGRGFYDAMCFKGGQRGVRPYATGHVQGYFPSPISANEDNLDLYVVAHEIGHNFSSPHTHCYVPPIDRCDNKENSCYNGDTVCSRGTLMSYCFQCPGGMANIDLTFHPRVVQYVMPVIQGSCLALAADAFAVYNDAASVLAVDSVRSTVDWLVPERDAFLVDPGDSILVPLRVYWDDILHAQNTGQVLIYSSDDPTASPLVLDVTAVRRRPRADFSASLTEGCWPLDVAFTDLTTNSPVSWVWSFGDKDSSAEQNPAHTFTHAGVYKVTLTATNMCGSHTVPQPITINVTEPAVCCSTATFVVTKNQSLQDARDMWACNSQSEWSTEDVQYLITENTHPECGASLATNRYLNIFPSFNWYGRSDVTISAITPDGCRCNTLTTIIVNDPPTITLSSPPAGTIITNRPYTIIWRDGDADDNALIRLYYTQPSGCSGGTEIETGGGILESLNEERGEFRWRITGVPDGLYRIRAVITDPFTSSEDCSPGLILLDQTPPTTTADVTCLEDEQAGWCHGDVRVDLSATDNLTGVQGIFYSINRGPWQLYTSSVLIERVGKTMIEFYAIDSAGNVEATQTAPSLIQIDRAAPRVERFDSDNPNFRSGDYTTKYPSFSILTSDDGVGIDPASIAIDLTPGAVDGPLHYTINDTNITFNPATRRIAVTSPTPLRQGSQKLMVTLADVLGNVTSASTDFVVGGGMAILDVVNFPNPFKHDTQFTFTLTEEPREVRVRIYDLSGVLMRELLATDVHEGFNEVYWDGLSDGGVTLANGAYLYEIIANGQAGTARHRDKLAILR